VIQQVYAVVPDRCSLDIERFDHLGIVAGGCRETGLAAWLDAQGTKNHEL
jgi:hypothetical protein